MSELEKAKQEVEQVCFAYDKAGDTGDIKDWKEYYDLENKLIDKVKIANQPQLTIPQSIADEFDQIYEDTEEYQKNVAQMFSSMQPYFVLESYPEILHWLEDDVKNTNVVLAYLAGKALGVDLVKVVEG